MPGPVASYTALFHTMFVKAVGYSYKYLHTQGRRTLGAEEAITPPHCKAGRQPPSF